MILVTSHRLLLEEVVPSEVRRRDGRVAEGARLESVFRGNSNVGSNPTLSASFLLILMDLHDALTSTSVHLTRHCLPYYSPMSFPHRVHHPSPIRIEGGLNGCVPHEFLLHR